MATRLPYYVGGDDIYTQLMRQFESEVPYYSAAPAGIAGGYDPSLYSRFLPAPSSGGEFTGDYSGLLGGGGDFGMQAPTTSTTGIGLSLGGLLGGGPSSTAAPGTVSTGLGGFSLSPSGTVTANTVSVPAATLAGLVTGLPLGAVAYGVNQAAQNAAAAQTAALADSASIASDLGFSTATAGPGGTGGAAAAAAAAAASAAAAAGLSDAAQGAAAQAAANAVVANNATPAEAAAAGQMAAGDMALSEGAGLSSGGSSASGASVADAVSMGDAVGIGVTGIGEGGADSGGGGGGGGGGKIICTKLHELGKMPTEIYEADQAFGAELIQNDPQAYYGYACWAQHVVRWMSRGDLFGKFVVFAAYHIATPWSKAMAQEMGVDVKSGWFGRFLMKHGLKVCRAIGEMKQDRSIQNV